MIISFMEMKISPLTCAAVFMCVFLFVLLVSRERAKLLPLFASVRGVQ